MKIIYLNVLDLAVLNHQVCHQLYRLPEMLRGKIVLNELANLAQVLAEPFKPFDHARNLCEINHLFLQTNRRSDPLPT